jgi:hypothetical protein
MNMNEYALHAHKRNRTPKRLTLSELIDAVTIGMNDCGYTYEQTKMITNDIVALMKIEKCIYTDLTSYNTIDELFEYGEHNGIYKYIDELTDGTRTHEPHEYVKHLQNMTFDE